MGNPLSTEQHTTYEQCISPITGKLDAHVWLEVEGKVIGIPIGGKAKKRHGKTKNKKTNRNQCFVDGDVHNPRWPIRKEFPNKELVKEVIQHSYREWAAFLNAIDCYTIAEIDAWLTKHNVDIHEPGRCCWRVCYMMMKYPQTFNEDTLRAGSLGKRYEDGKVRWEFG